MTLLQSHLLTLTALLLLTACGGGARDSLSPADKGWFSSWGTAIYTSFPNGPLTQDGFSPNTALFVENRANNQSFRQFIRPSTGGERLRLHFSNRFGDQPLVLESVSVALRLGPAGPAIDMLTQTPVQFAGKPGVTIAAGEQRVSDPVPFTWQFGDDLGINFFVDGSSGALSWHAEAFAVQHVGLPNSGDLTADPTGASFGGVERGWFFLRGLDAQLAEAPGYSVVFFGDSITDGFASTPELNHRYPDFVARRLQTAGHSIGVVNAGINSNRVLDGGVLEGEAGLSRFAEDVIGRAGVASVFILLGTNDLSAGRSAQEVYAGLLQLADQAHAAGICTVVSTILPRNDPPFPFGWDAETEEPERQALNQMILRSSQFDAVVDLASAMADPLRPQQPFAAYFVEGLHPNSLGMQAMANAIPLETLLRSPEGTCTR